jgi:hypothetical protein
MFCLHVRASSTGTFETSWSIVRRHWGTVIRVPRRTLHLRSTIISRGCGPHAPRVLGGRWGRGVASGSTEDCGWVPILAGTFAPLDAGVRVWFSHLTKSVD